MLMENNVFFLNEKFQIYQSLELIQYVYITWIWLVNIFLNFLHTFLERNEML